MRSSLVALIAFVAAATPAMAQQPAGRMLLSVRSSDTTRVAEMTIDVRGQLFQRLGISEGTTGSLRLEGDGGSATGTVVGEISEKTGELVFTTSLTGPELELRVWPASGALPRLVAVGHTVRVVRGASGRLEVKTGL